MFESNKCAAEDIDLIDAINDAIASSDFGDSAADAIRHKLHAQIAKHEFPLSRLGCIALCEIAPSPGISGLVWERFFGDRVEGLPLDSSVTVLDAKGHPVAQKKVCDFTTEELLRFTGSYFWLLDTEHMPVKRALAVSVPFAEQFAQKTKAAHWNYTKFESAVKKTDLATRKGISNPFFVGLVTVTGMGNPFWYVAEDEGPQAVLDGTPVCIFDLQGKEVARKRFVDFTDEEILKYGVDHIWCAVES
jgi:hypothetical protein